MGEYESQTFSMTVAEIAGKSYKRIDWSGRYRDYSTGLLLPYGRCENGVVEYDGRRGPINDQHLFTATNNLLRIIETVEKQGRSYTASVQANANEKIQKLESDIVRYERMVQELRERVQMLEMKQEYEQQRSFENWFEETHSFELPE